MWKRREHGPTPGSVQKLWEGEGRNKSTGQPRCVPSDKNGTKRNSERVIQREQVHGREEQVVAMRIAGITQIN